MTEITKELMNAVTEASAGSLFVRGLLENQLAIVDVKKLRTDILGKVLDKVMVFETEKFQILLNILRKGAESVSQLVIDTNLTDLSVMKHLLALENEGWLELRDQDNLTYGVKTLVTKIDDNLELDLVSPWNLRSVYEPIKIIVDAHLCVLCGACKAVCPVEAITIADDKPKIDEDKCIHCGLCNFHCPRTLLPINILKAHIAGHSPSNYFQDLKEQPFGPHQILKSAQTLNKVIKAACQDGGMVSAFLQYLFEKNEIDGAVVAKRKPNSWDTEPILVTSFEGVLEASGTKYAVSPNFVGLKDARTLGCEQIAFVGTPCQVQAMRKYQAYSNIFEDLWGSIQYVIGIFCMESFAYPSVIKIAEEFCKTPIANVSKMDINKGKFFVYDMNKNASEIPIKEVTSLARHACHYCVDLTNELADISCGSIGSGPGFSTVIVRTDKGKRIYDAALKAKYFQVKNIPEDKPFGTPLIKKLANGKRKRNFKGLKKILDEIPPDYYNSLKQILKYEEQ